MDAPPNPPAGPPAQDHGKACSIAMLVTLVTMGMAGAAIGLGGMPRGNGDPVFFVVCSLLGFSFCGGQAAAITGFMASKQRQNPLWIGIGIVGALLGLGAFAFLFVVAIAVGLAQSGVRF